MMSLEELKSARPRRPQPSRLLMGLVALTSLVAVLTLCGAAWELYQAHTMGARPRADYLRNSRQ